MSEFFLSQTCLTSNRRQRPTKLKKLLRSASGHTGQPNLSYDYESTDYE